MFDYLITACLVLKQDTLRGAIPHVSQGHNKEYVLVNLNFVGKFLEFFSELLRTPVDSLIKLEGAS